ncbi:MAG: fused MFS/spermidine synthase [Alphaproteobacteria bacterium]
MTRLQNTLFLFVIIILEGFIVLSSELMAIRLTIPFVGSGTDTISIIIAAVLMPLAIGYHAGGNFKKKRPDGTYRTIRTKLINNILISAAFLIPALSYFILQFFFFAMDEAGIENNIIQTTLYCLFFIVTPVFLLGQTVPLISNYFSKERLSQITGKMLCFSTLGSFGGSIITTLVLMQYIGTHHTVSVLFALMSILVLMLAKKNMRTKTLIILGMFGFSIMINSNQIMEMLHIVKNNKYSTMMIMTLDEENNEIPHLIINNNDSSKYAKETTEKHEYIEFAEKITIEAIPETAAPKDVLIIGAGGFTYGHNDKKNNFVYIDIDKDLKEISEKYILKEKLKPNKIFYPLPARAYLGSTNKKFDIILLDAYLGGLSIPEHLVTQEFFTEIKEHLNDKGVLVSNFILSPNFNNIFSKNIDNTLRSVFPYISRHDAHNDYKIWTKSQSENSNFVYIYKHFENLEAGAIYIDDN